jgi:hypothetical protein
MTIRKRKIVRLILVALFTSVFLIATVNAIENDSNACFEEYENDPEIFACRGKLPDAMDKKWNSSIRNCWINLTRMGRSEFDSSFRAIGSRDRVLNVYLSSDYQDEIDDARIDKIYNIIENYCEEQEGINEVPVVFLWQEDEIWYPEYGHESFERIQNESWLITTKGTVPEIDELSEKIAWTDKLTKVTENVEGMEQYYYDLYGDRTVYGFGAHLNGYITVEFNSETPELINESVINDIYQMIDEKAEEEGINDVPVVFRWSEKDIEVTEDTPGFTSMMLVLGLALAIGIRRV